MGTSPVRVEDYRAAQSLGYLLRRAHKLSMTLAEALFADEDISFVQWVVLIQLRDGVADTSGGLARNLVHDSGAITRMLGQLEERGLVARRRSADDRRVVHLDLTTAGIAAANRMVPHIVALWNDLLVGFTAGEAQMLGEMLQRLLGRLETRIAETAA